MKDGAVPGGGQQHAGQCPRAHWDLSALIFMVFGARLSPQELVFCLKQQLLESY